jgi:DUF1680 family protein
MMFGHRMNALTKEASYYDTVERALYNTVLAGINVTGDRYFYVNPLEVVPEFCMDHSYMMHVKPDRQKWFHVACCPPNIARTLASLGQYIYTCDRESVYINQFISSEAEIEIGKSNITLDLYSTLLQDGKIRLVMRCQSISDISIKIRIPEYAGKVRVKQNGKESEIHIEKGYALFSNLYRSEEVIEIDFDVKAHFVSANDMVREDEGKVALMKGPCVYCMEEKDNGGNLASVYVKADVKLDEDKPLDLFGEIPTLSYEGYRLTNMGVRSEELYGDPAYEMIPVILKATPYCLWNNRGGGEMLVWQKVRF